MTTKVKALIAALLLSLVLLNIAFASEIVPYADTEFSRATASLTTNKTVSFSCLTIREKEKISITSCWLQKKTNNKWSWAGSLEAPTTIATNTMLYAVVMDYSDKIGSGTYRIGFTINADGHAITRYSNERTF